MERDTIAQLNVRIELPVATRHRCDQYDLTIFEKDTKPEQCIPLFMKFMKFLWPNTASSGAILFAHVPKLGRRAHILSYLKLSGLLFGRSYKLTCIYSYKICVISQFGRILILILLVPGHGLTFTLVKTELF